MFGFPKISEEGGVMARMIAVFIAGRAPSNSTTESVMLQQLFEASKKLAQEVEAGWQTAPQSSAMCQTPGDAK